MKCVLSLGALLLLVIGLPAAESGATSKAEKSASTPLLESGAASASIRRNRFLSWRSAEARSPLLPDAELRCASSCVIRTPEGSELELDPGTRLTIGQPTYVPSLHGGSAALGWVFDLKEGSLQALVATHPKRRAVVVINLPNDVSAAASPGSARFTAPAASTFTPPPSPNLPAAEGVTCLEGEIRLRVGTKVVRVGPGEGVGLTSASNGEEFAPEALGDAPAVRKLPREGDLSPFAVTFEGAPARVGAAWRPVPDAAAYRIEIARDAAFADRLETRWIDAGRPALSTNPLPPGTYYARATAELSSGLETKASDPAVLRIATLSTPPGGSVDPSAHTLFGPPGSALALDDPNGIDVSVDGGRFYPATRTVRFDLEAHSLALRSHASPIPEVPLFIAPRGLRAAIRMDPIWARWPDDPIDVKVRIEDPSGHFNPTSVTPKFEVLVGIEPIDVDWTRVGEHYRAHISPRQARGPVVLRVIATDDQGAFLGRKSLEIERAPRPLTPAPAWSRAR